MPLGCKEQQQSDGEQFPGNVGGEPDKIERTQERKVFIISAHLLELGRPGKPEPVVQIVGRPFPGQRIGVQEREFALHQAASQFRMCLDGQCMDGRVERKTLDPRARLSRQRVPVDEFAARAPFRPEETQHLAPQCRLRPAEPLRIQRHAPEQRKRVVAESGDFSRVRMLQEQTPLCLVEIDKLRREGQPLLVVEPVQDGIRPLDHPPPVVSGIDRRKDLVGIGSEIRHMDSGIVFVEGPVPTRHE